ncbi:VOC family protein [Shewanella sp. AS16]|uniref:VOC family protein n=1 Tax=Shewanella sp. AS16 TaxID=2907625 RepID=UPI001F47D64C|nr:VOC family protein [Shewanella sp. AS16]MCE9684875.1 VOC family protein [Shewanella sp. AS16]
MTALPLSSDALDAGWPAFVQAIQEFITRLGLTRLQLECDHAALRVNSVAAADALRLAFSRRGQVISEAKINGRPILIIKLDEPLQLGPMAVECIELPYPGDKHYPQEGWEHIELVLPSQARDCQALAAELLARVPALAPVLAGDTDIEVKLSSPKGDGERLANPTIAFKAGPLCIKLHPHSIQAIVASEAQTQQHRPG